MISYTEKFDPNAKEENVFTRIRKEDFNLDPDNTVDACQLKISDDYDKIMVIINFMNGIHDITPDSDPKDIGRVFMTMYNQDLELFNDIVSMMTIICQGKITDINQTINYRLKEMVKASIEDTSEDDTVSEEKPTEDFSEETLKPTEVETV